MMHKTPEAVVQAQLAAYNAKDLPALLATYAPDAEQYILHGELLAKGHAAIAERFRQRFTEPDLYARLLHRTVFAEFVVDVEAVTRNFPQGKGTVELLCVYQVVDGLIVKASFAFGQQQLLAG
jgi:hypothetical protein